MFESRRSSTWTTVWGYRKMSSGNWALAPLGTAAASKIENQAAMVALGRPGAGEQLLARQRFEDVERLDISFPWEFPDPHSFARTLSSTGPTAHKPLDA